MDSQQPYTHQNNWKVKIPGLKNETFKIKIKKDWLGRILPDTFKVAMINPPFNKGDDIKLPQNENHFEVTKVYKMTWWKKSINKTWFKRNWFIGIKVKIKI